MNRVSLVHPATGAALLKTPGPQSRPISMSVSWCEMVVDRELMRMELTLASARSDHSPDVIDALSLSGGTDVSWEARRLTCTRSCACDINFTGGCEGHGFTRWCCRLCNNDVTSSRIFRQYPPMVELSAAQEKHMAKIAITGHLHRHMTELELSQCRLQERDKMVGTATDGHALRL